jgi:hypothetical protein
MSGLDAKYLSRVDVFRFALEIGHCSAHSAHRIWAHKLTCRK